MHNEDEQFTSDDEFEIIRIDPNVIYSSDDDSEQEEERKTLPDVNKNILPAVEQTILKLPELENVVEVTAPEEAPEGELEDSKLCQKTRRKMETNEFTDIEHQLEMMYQNPEEVKIAMEELEIAFSEGDSENCAKKIKYSSEVDVFRIEGQEEMEVETEEVADIPQSHPKLVEKVEQEIKIQSNPADMEDGELEDKFSNLDQNSEDVNSLMFFKSEADSTEPLTEMDTSVDVSCDNSFHDENSNDSVRKVRRKLNLEEYKMRRAKEKPEMTKPLFDLPKKLAAYELTDLPATLPMLILPTDSNSFSMMSGDDNATFAPEDSKMIINLENYEEIRLVSMGCNTDISIPPEEKKQTTNCFKNIVNTLNKDNVEQLMKSSTTLFSSIQAVVVGKCTTSDSVENSNEAIEHGEDKIIMHLRKDRLKPFKCTAGVQTETHSLFPPLIISPTAIYNRTKQSRSYRRKISRSRSRSRSPIDDYNQVKCQKRYARSRHSTHSSSMNSSSSSSNDSDSGSGSDSDSSDYSTDSLQHFNDRHNFRFYDRNQRNQGFANYPEERRIIYIGQLEEETTKDEIRKKFLQYGTIKKISMHVKEDGLRYGFVTFADAECAYKVLDKFSKDPLINKYDIRFGGRRKFCKQTYADLDSLAVEKEYTEPLKSEKEMSFEDLLKAAKKKLLAKK